MKRELPCEVQLVLIRQHGFVQGSQFRIWPSWSVPAAAGDSPSGKLPFLKSDLRAIWKSGSWREAGEQITSSWTAVRPQTHLAFSKDILWWEEVEAEAEYWAQCRGHNILAVAGWYNVFCNLLVPCVCAFSTRLKKGLCLTAGSLKRSHLSTCSYVSLFVSLSVLVADSTSHLGKVASAQWFPRAGSTGNDLCNRCMARTVFLATYTCIHVYWALVHQGPINEATRTIL